MSFNRDARESQLRGYDSMKLGLVGQFLGGIVLACTLDTNASTAQFVAELIIVLGTALLVAGCGTYANYHGYSRWWGILGLLSFPGVILVLLKRPIPHAYTPGGGFEVRYAKPYHRDVWRMDVRVELDDSVGAGVAEPIMLQVPRGASVEAAIKMLAGPIPVLKDVWLDLRYQINDQPAKPLDELSNGDKLLVTRSQQSAPPDAKP